VAGTLAPIRPLASRSGRPPLAAAKLALIGGRLWYTKLFPEAITDTRIVTQLLHEFADGDKAAFDRLVPLVYDELRRIAEGHLRHERAGHTLQATALVHEVYARMVDQQQPDYRGRAHFLAIASQVMRKILIDHARIKHAAKRGSGQENFPIDDARDACQMRPAVLIQLDDSLTALAEQDPRMARLVEMRYFGGLTAEESAEALDIEVRLVRRELRLAQAWLQRELGATAGPI
jgi:RNA polymerase sigma-70 factor, ECF subfamily